MEIDNVQCKYCNAETRRKYIKFAKNSCRFYCWQCDAENFYTKEEIRELKIKEILDNEIQTDKRTTDSE